MEINLQALLLSLLSHPNFVVRIALRFYNFDLEMQGYSFTPPTGPPREGHKSKASMLLYIAKAQRKFSWSQSLISFNQQTMYSLTNTTDIKDSRVCHPPMLNVKFLFTKTSHLVMRACNGCRKRKIKCDAATTNTWPCSACTRLKLVCVPPTVGQDSEFPTGQGVEANPTNAIGASNTTESFSSFSMPQGYRDSGQATVGGIPPYSDGMGMFPQFTHSASHQTGMYEVGSPALAVSHQTYQQQQTFPSQTESLGTIESGVYGDHEQSTAEDLSEVLGELKIDETGIGMV